VNPIVYSKHAQDQMLNREVSEYEVEITIQEGEMIPAKKGRLAFRKNFHFESEWKGKYYEVKQVMPIVVEENEQIIVITVYAFYFGGSHEN
jgi:hypothetical protein